MFEYRDEIDGLRAVAVLSVVFYHAGFLTFFAGGYVGVDIFFVISGYLITSLIEHDYQQQRFSLIHFYERRCRRILPALILILAMTSVCASLWMMNDQLKEYGQTLISIVGLSSNFFFWWKDDGYFSQITELNPLVHTWSLAVEEQFYMFFPLIYLCCRHHQRLFHVILVCSGVFSFMLCQWGGHFEIERSDRQFHLFSQHSFASFYLPMGRAWELLLGSLVAFRLQDDSCDRMLKWKNYVSLVGLMMVITSIVFLDSRSIPTFPNAYTLLPTVGSVLLLLYGRKETWVGQCLSLKVLRWIGLISYSVYLWHQPCLAFLRLQSTDTPSMAMIVVSISLVFPLSTLTYLFVEQPFRRKESFSRKQIFSLALASAIMTMMMGIYLIDVSNNRTTILNKENDTYLADLHRYGHWEYVVRDFDRLGARKKTFSQERWAENKRLMLIGDSFAQDFYNMMIESNHLINYDICVYFIFSRCQIYLGPEDRLQFVEAKHKQACTNANDIKYALPLIRQSNVIILSNNWYEWSAQRLPITLKSLNLTEKQRIFVIGPKHFGNVNPKLYINKTKEYRLKQRLSSKTSVVLVNDLLERTIDKSIYVNLQRLACRRANHTCDLFTPNGKLISHDGAHLTKYGAEYLGKIIFQQYPLKTLINDPKRFEHFWIKLKMNIDATRNSMSHDRCEGSSIDSVCFFSLIHVFIDNIDDDRSIRRIIVESLLYLLTYSTEINEIDEEMYSGEINEENSKQILNERKYYMFPPFWVIVVGLFAVVIAILGVLLGGIGIFREKSSNENESMTNLDESQCFVYYLQTIEHPCSNLICYDQRFKVSYLIFNGSEILSTILIKNLQEKSSINIGETHRCFYDRFDDVTSVQWNRTLSSSTTFRSSRTVFLSVGLTLIIVASILIVITLSSMIFHSGIRFKHLQRRNQMLKHFSDDHF